MAGLPVQIPVMSEDKHEPRVNPKQLPIKSYARIKLLPCVRQMLFYVHPY